MRDRPQVKAKGDFARVLSAWKQASALPILSVSLSVTATALATIGRSAAGNSQFGNWTFGGFLLLTTLSAGYAGTERLWYRQLWEGGRLSLTQVLHITTRYLGRYLRLGLMVGFVGVLWGLGVTLVIGNRSAAIFLVTVPFIFISDVLLTFVTPALALSTPSAVEAIRIGIGVLSRTWPECAMYVLIPGLSAVLISRLALTRYPVAAVAAAAVVALLVLALKGATASFYLHAAQALDISTHNEHLQLPYG